MGALLPAEQRYTNNKFRRVARRFDATRLDYADAAELAAFVETVGHKASRWIFGWDPYTLVEAKRLLTHMRQFPDHARMVSENNEAPTREDGLAVLAAMRDGGWNYGGIPPVVRLAFLDMAKSGLSRPAIGKLVGMTKEQVRNISTGVTDRRARRSTGLVGLVAG